MQQRLDSIASGTLTHNLESSHEANNMSTRVETLIERQTMSRRWGSFSSVLLRFGLGVGFLSAVADRLGLWGAFGQPNVEWGNFSRFLEYTHTLNWYLPAGMIPALGVVATGVEILCGLLLLVGWHTRATALL